jgi:hypothetical protein
MNNFLEKQRQYFLYIYDLPKQFISGTEIAKYLYQQTGVLLTKFPIIHREKQMFQPFYSAIVSF